VRKDQQQTVGSKAGAKEIGDTLRTGGENLSEIPRTAPTQSAKQQTNQINKTGKKKTTVEQLGRRGTQKVGHKREKMAKEKGVKHRTKVRKYQVNCIAQRVEDKGRRGGSEGHPSTHLCSTHRDLNPCKIRSHIRLPYILPSLPLLTL
jgi:hypothetical protein